jgi:hypothetical protein
MMQREAALLIVRVALASAIWLAANVLLLSPARGAANACTEAEPIPETLVEMRVAALGAADLEEAFWICDYTATTVGMGATPIGLCSAVYDELKARKFNGDFEQLLYWWRQNKPAEHARQAAGTSRRDASYVQPTPVR